MGQNFNLKNYFLLIFCISIFSLLSAIYIEFVLDQKPCKLCIYQRVPYIIAIFICFLGFAVQKKTNWLFFLSIIFIFSSFLAGYHVGIENNIFDLNAADRADRFDSVYIIYGALVFLQSTGRTAERSRWSPMVRLSAATASPPSIGAAASFCAAVTRACA